MVLNYIGSKRKLLNLIDHIITNYCQVDKQNEDVVFGDLLAGTCVVSNYFSNRFNVVCNDIEQYSYCIGSAFLNCEYNENLKNKIDLLNKLEPIEGLIYKNYAPHENTNNNYENIRQFFTPENAKKCDAMREKINEWFQDNEINQNEYLYLLACIISNTDKIANTASIYGAYLKDFKKSAILPLTLSPIHKKNNIINNHRVFNNDINDVLDIEYDIVYIDPPYNSRQYGGNYHVLNYIFKYDENIELYGKTGLIKDYFKSNFCRKDYAYDELNNIIKNIKAKYVLISYNNEGILTIKNIQNILSQRGIVTTFQCFYKKYKSQKKQEDEFVTEYVHLVKINNNEKYINKKFKVIEL